MPQRYRRLRNTTSETERHFATGLLSKYPILARTIRAALVYQCPRFKQQKSDRKPERLLLKLLILLASPREVGATRFFNDLRSQPEITALLRLKAFLGICKPQNRAMTASRARLGAPTGRAEFCPGGTAKRSGSLRAAGRCVRSRRAFLSVDCLKAAQASVHAERGALRGG
jgi:hypothetical protein